MYPEEVIHYISGNYTEEEKKIVEEWVNEDPARMKELEQLKRVWEITEDLQLQIDTDKGWKNIIYQTQEYRDRTNKPSENKNFISNLYSNSTPIFLKAAAVLLVILSSFGFYFHLSNQAEYSEIQETVYETLNAPDGEIVKYRFNDGSVVVLNSGSQIKYRQDFDSDRRVIELEGEAYFEVESDQQTPFTVKIDDFEVRDIGTKFNINAYPESQGSEVVVTEGLVEVTKVNQTGTNESKNEPATIRLSEGYMLKHNSQNEEFVVQEANLQRTLKWLTNALIFDETTFSEIIQQLEDHYDVEIIVLNDELLNKRLTASFENESIENVMTILTASLDADFTKEENIIRVY